MKKEESPFRTPQSDELDLSNIVEIFNRFFGAIFRSILKVFFYLKRNGIKLVILILVGLGIGFGLNQLVEKKQKMR